MMLVAAGFFLGVLVGGTCLAQAPGQQVLHPVLEAPAPQEKAELAGMILTRLSPAQVQEVAQAYGRPCGVRVDSVVPSSPAQRAGILAGDFLVGARKPGERDFHDIRHDVDRLAELAAELDGAGLSQLLLLRKQGTAWTKVEADLASGAAPGGGAPAAIVDPTGQPAQVAGEHRTLQGPTATVDRLGQPVQIADQARPGIVLQPAEPDTKAPPATGTGSAQPTDSAGATAQGSVYGVARQALTEGGENGAPCHEDAHCKSGYCADGTYCAPKDGTGREGEYCHHDNHCAEGLFCDCKNRMNLYPSFCSGWERKNFASTCARPYPDSHSCYRDVECTSGNCADVGFYANDYGRCAPEDGTGQEGDYCHHDNHCATGTCYCPAGKTLGFCQDFRDYHWSEMPAMMKQGFFVCSGKFALGDGCSKNEQCASGHCANGKYCAPKDGTGAVGDYCHHENHCKKDLWCRCSPWIEEDVLGFCPRWEVRDSTGSCAEPMENGEHCVRNDQCRSGYCANIGSVKGTVGYQHLRTYAGRCAPRDGTGREGEYCHHDNHCETKYCVCPGKKSFGFCANWENYDVAEGRLQKARASGYFECSGKYGLGELCTRNDQCGSGYCANGQRCAPPDGTGDPGDYCHHDNHCMSGICECPMGKSWGFCANWEDGENLGKCK